MATVEQLTIQFEGKGAPKLTAQLNSLSKAMNRLAARQIEATKATNKASKATDSYNDRGTKNGRNVDALTKSFGAFGKKMSQTRSKLLIVAFAVGLVTKSITSLSKAFSDYAVLNAKINAVLKSTSRASGLTSSSLDKMANSIETNFGVSSSAVKEMQSRLLTFTNIVGSTFKEAQVAAVNLSVVFGGDLNQATIQLGKALNDPVKGYTALKRVGVSFSSEQISQIKNFQAQGDIMSAQKVILNELSIEMGGTAKAAAKAAMGQTQMTLLGNELSSVMRDLGEILQPVIAAFGLFFRAITFIVHSFTKLITATPKIVAFFAAWVTGQANIKAGLDVWQESEQKIRATEQSLLALNGTYLETAKNSKGFTSIDELEKLKNKIVELTESNGFFGNNTEEINKLQEEFAEKIQKNTNIINLQSNSQDEYNTKVSDTTKKLKDMITLQAISTDKAKMEYQMGTLQANGLRTLSVEQQTLIDKYFNTKKAIEDKTEADKKAIEDKTEADKKAASEQEKLESAIKSSETSLLQKLKTLELEQNQIKGLTTLQKLNIKLLDENGEATRVLTEDEKKYAVALDEVLEKTKALKEEEAGRAAVKEKAIEFASSLTSSFQESSQAQMDAVKQQQQFELEQLRNSRRYQKSSDKDKKKAENAIMESQGKAMQKAFNRNKNARYAQVAIDTSAAVINALASLNPPQSFVVAALTGAMGAQQLANIKASKAPKFAYGGMVGGRPHSQGGTTIEAERGEFVMRRKAVDAIGLETLNRMNEGGSSSSVSVNISGNVLSKDFIEDEAIPQIKEAIRRGADIGVG